MSVIWREAPTQPTGLKFDTPLNTAVRQRLAAIPLVRYHHVKRWLDRAAALVLLVPGLPLMGVLILIVRLTSKGPGVYSQLRVGRNGRTFTMFKLRSMRCDAEALLGPTWSTGEDPRITKVGKVLRKLHLDELPQLFNVLKGEMSLIGPRPERPEFVEILAQDIPDYVDRLAVEPGVTGLAQINLPADTDLDSVRRKLVLDQEYIATASPWLDLRIVLCTLLRMVGLPGERAMSLTRVRRHVNLPASGPVATNPATPGDAAADTETVNGGNGVPAPHTSPVPVAMLARQRQTPPRKEKGSGILRRNRNEEGSGIHGSMTKT